jgi:RsiW-degrading membrane proteinase PrsW (M82 family)
VTLVIVSGATAVAIMAGIMEELLKAGAVSHACLPRSPSSSASAAPPDESPTSA